MTVPPSSKQEIVYLKRENDDEITTEASSEQMTFNEKPAQAEGKHLNHRPTLTKKKIME